MSDLPTTPGGFGCILADPPWDFRGWSDESSVPTQAVDPYITLPTLELAQLPVEAAAAKDAVLLMWVVDSHIEQALALGEAWGFVFKTAAFVWVKSKPGGWPMFGMGLWTRKQTEQCWLFTRGSPKRLSKGVAQIIHCPRGAHSAKPEQQYERIEALVGGPYLELFARQTRRGWTAWGDQVGCRDGSLFGELV
jgi:N6-adenosine-specific RNA methylase IME4